MGIRSTNLERRFSIDELIGNVTEEGVLKTTRLPFSSLATQLAATGPFIFGNVLYVATRAQLLAITPATETMGGVVLNDSNAAYNGYYSRVAAAWVRQRGFPDTFAQLTVSGGTANAVQATTSVGVDPASIEVFYIEPSLTNLGNVTLVKNGAAAKPVRNVNGDELAPGEWTAGRKIMLVEDETEFRLLSDPDADGAAAAAAASAVAAGADADRAEDAADVASGAMTTVLDPQFATVATAAAWTPAVAPDFIRTAYFDADQVPGSGALYKNVGASEPSHAAKFSITLSPSATVVWFEIDVAIIDVSMIGGKPGGAGDQGALFNSVQVIGNSLSAGGEYQINTTWDLEPGKIWDCRKLVLTHTVDGIDVVRADEVDDWVIRGDLEIQGKFTPALPYANHAALIADVATIADEGTVGFRITHSKGWRIDGLSIEGIEGDALLLDGVVDAGEVRGDRGVIVAPKLRYNLRGLVTPPSATGAEYFEIASPLITANRYGVDIAAGNLQVSGGNVVDNGAGVLLRGEEGDGDPAVNHLHGNFVGTFINHNGDYNIRADDVLFGHTFTGCHIFGDPAEGKVDLNNSRGITIAAGVLSSPIEIDGAEGHNSIVDNLIFDPTVATVTGTAVRQTQFGGNYTFSGAWKADLPAHVYVDASRGTSTQALSSGVAATLVFNAEGSDFGGNYDTSTGGFVAPTDGVYEFNVAVRVTGTGLEPGSVLFVAAAATKERAPLVINQGATVAIAKATFWQFLTAGQGAHIEASIVGTSPVVAIDETRLGIRRLQ